MLSGRCGVAVGALRRSGVPGALRRSGVPGRYGVAVFRGDILGHVRPS